MTLTCGRDILALPGPTTLPDEVLNASHRQPVDIYDGPLLETTDSCLEDLRRVFRTKGKTYIYASNGHGGWEAALTNVLNRGDKILVLESGRFALGWGEMADMLGIDVEVLPGAVRRAVDAEALEARLRNDSEGAIKAILVVQVDTASGVYNDIARLRQAIDAAGHGALFMVDVIASLGTMPFEMDDWGVDIAVAGSQKGLMTPPGLALLAAGERAMAAHPSADLRTLYWDWTFRDGEEHYQKYCGTPPEQLLFALRKALDLLFAEGLEAVFTRHRLLAGAVQRAVSVWAEGGAVDHNILKPEERSDSVTSIRLDPSYDPADLRRYCKDVCGIVLGSGIGPLSGKGFRIAHMGHVGAPAVLASLGGVEIAMQALGIPHGRGGVQAAIDWLAEQVPG